MDYREFHSEFPHGSARFADDGDVQRAGLLRGEGLFLGYWGRRALQSSSDAPVLVCAGSGSGKSRDLYMQLLSMPSRESFLVLDPKGELFTCSHLTHARQEIRTYTVNLMADEGVIPAHGCTVLDILKPNCPALFENARLLISAMIAENPGEKYFSNRARDWMPDIAVSDVESNGSTSLPRLYDILAMIDGDPNGWEAYLEQMLNSRYAPVRKTAAEMFKKSLDAPKEFSGVLGEINNALEPLKSPRVRKMLEGGFSLEELTDGRHPVRVHLCIDGDVLKDMASIVRPFFQAVMIYKGRRPSSPRVNLLIDEAAQLSKFDALKTAMSYSRGKGVRTIVTFQDIGQIEEHYSKPGVKTFFGNSETKVFFGVRDYETAQLISNMMGTATNEIHQKHEQENARRKAGKIAMEVIDGRSPLEAANDYIHYLEASRRPHKQARPLMSAAEILSMPEDKAIILISGKGVPPIIADKHPYYSRAASREMNLRYLPHPSHEPRDKVRLWGFLRSRWVRAVRRPVPEEYRYFPQYAFGHAVSLEDHPL